MTTPSDAQTPAAAGASGMDERELDRLLSRARDGADIGAATSALGALRMRIGQYPELDDDIQDELAMRVQRARRAAAVLNDPERRATLPDARVRQLRREASTEERDHEFLVGSMLRLVVLIAQETTKKMLGRKMMLSLQADVVSDGCAAVSIAVDSYDLSEGKFHRYAAVIIRSEIRKALESYRPVKMRTAWDKVRRICSGLAPKLAQELGREPTIDELRRTLEYQALRYAAKQISDLKRSQMTAEQIAEEAQRRLVQSGMWAAIRQLDLVLAVPDSHTPLDAPVRGAGIDGPMTVADSIVDTDHADPEDEAARQEMRRDVATALRALPERSQIILSLRFGLDGKGPRTLTEIKDEMDLDITTERVRQLEKIALKKLGSAHGQFSLLARHLPSGREPDADAATLAQP